MLFVKRKKKGLSNNNFRKVGGKLLLRYEHALIWHRSMHFRLPFFLQAIHNLAKIFMKSPINLINIFKSPRFHKKFLNFSCNWQLKLRKNLVKLQWCKNSKKFCSHCVFATKKVPNLNGLQLVKEIETNKSLLNSTVLPNDIFFRSAVHMLKVS